MKRRSVCKTVTFCPDSIQVCLTVEVRASAFCFSRTCLMNCGRNPTQSTQAGFIG